MFWKRWWRAWKEQDLPISGTIICGVLGLMWLYSSFGIIGSIIVVPLFLLIANLKVK